MGIKSFRKFNKEGDLGSNQLILLIVAILGLFVISYFLYSVGILEKFDWLIPDFSHQNVTKQKEKVVFSCDKIEKSSSLSSNYLERYEEYKELFFKNCKMYPHQFDYKSFIALLFSVAQRESSVGHPEKTFKGFKRDDFLLGYGSSEKNKEAYAGPEKQIKYACSTLTFAFKNENEKYKVCYNYEGENKLKCILSVYNSGEDYFIPGELRKNKKEDGIKYADTVLSYYPAWQSYICKEKPDIYEKQYIALIESMQGKKEISLGFWGKIKEALIKIKNFLKKVFSKKEEITAREKEIIGLNLKDALKYSSENEKKIFFYAVDFVGEDTVRIYNGREYKDNVCAKFVSNVLEKFYESKGKEFKGSVSVLGLEEILKKQGWIKIYDYDKEGSLEKMSEINKERILVPGRIIVVPSKLSNSGFHIGILAGFNKKENEFCYIDDKGKDDKIKVSCRPLKIVRRIYSLPDYS